MTTESATVHKVDSEPNLFIGVLFAVFTAIMKVLSMPPNKRPSILQALAQFGLAASAGWLVGAGLNHYTSLPEDLIYGLVGASGWYGPSVYVALGEFVDKKWGTSIVKKK